MVGYVLTESEGAVGMDAGQDFDLVELVHQDGSLGLEGLIVLGSPPVGHVAVLVEQASLVVESMGHLVADHDSDGAVVDGVVSLGIEERRLEYACGEAYLVGSGIVVCIDGLGRHEPFLLVHGLAEIGEIVGHVPSGDSAHVLEVAQGRIDLEGGIVFPFVGITYLDVEGGEFLLGPGLGFVAHPFQVFDMVGEGTLEVVHQVEHPLLVALGEILFDIELADCLTEDSVGYGHGPLPAGPLLLDT